MFDFTPATFRICVGIVDGINELSGFPLPSFDGRRRRGLRLEPRPWDSRECSGPMSEATLHRPSPSRALAAGAIALAAIAPALDPAEQAAEAIPPTHPEAVAARVESVVLDPRATFAERSETAQRATRAAVRRVTGVNRALATRTAKAARTAAERESRQLRAEARRAAAAAHALQALKARQIDRARSILSRRVATTPHRRVVTRHATPKRAQKVVPLRGGMTAVVDFARSQVGRSYVRGGEGRSGFDCSGFTKRAYALAGISLPHSSGGQAARARTISRSQARPGDLVVGPGHVGIYMGRGMMIDAGNSRTGVVYRKLYAGLRVARF